MRQLVIHDADGRPLNALSVWPADYPEHLAAAGTQHVVLEDAPAVLWDCRIVDGAAQVRPACPATVTVTGRTIALAGIPAGSSVSAEIEDETVHLAETSFELDEAGPVTIVITPPWPYLEARHDLEIE